MSADSRRWITHMQQHRDLSCSLFADAARRDGWGGLPSAGRQPPHHPRQGSPGLLEPEKGRLLREDRYHQTGEFPITQLRHLPQIH